VKIKRTNSISCLLFAAIMFFPFIFDKGISAEENVATRNRYTFNYDQEIPTLIRYGSKVSGYMCRTGYIGIITREDGRSRSSIDIGYNVTIFELSAPPSFGRSIAIFGLGYIPFIPDISYFVPGDERNITMFSPLIGYSYSQRVYSWFRFGLSANAGPVHVKHITPWKNREEFESDQQNDYYNYDEWVEAYDVMGNISGKFGGRINLKTKLFFLNSSSGRVHFGIGAGYTQFIFAENHFNSYDIGLDFTFAF